MNLAVIGSGGREHAICYKLRQSKKLKKTDLHTWKCRNAFNSNKHKRGYF